MREKFPAGITGGFAAISHKKRQAERNQIMEKSAKYIILKGVAVMLFVAIAGFFLFNGFSRYPYEKAELEDAFRARAEEVGIEGHGAEELISAEYANSVTFLMRTEDGERVCASYACSMFSGKYKEINFYSGVNGVLALDEMTYTISDGAMSYDVTISFGEQLSITPSDTAMPILYVKLILICVVLMIFFGAKMFLNGRKR